MIRFSSHWLLCFLLMAGAAFAQGSALPVVPYTEDNPVASNDLTAEIIDRFREAKLGDTAKLSVHVVEARRGTTVVDINSRLALPPASLMKLFTAAAAIDLLGPEQTFFTTVETDGTIANGVLTGDLVLRGGGDPSLGPRFHSQQNDVTRIFRDWARELRKAGIRRIDGNVIGNDLRYQDDPVGLGWDTKEFAEWYSAEVSALNFNDNCIDILWQAGSRVGDRASFQLVPDTSFVTFASSVRVGPNSQKTARLRYFRFPNSNEIRARGSLPPDSRKYDFAAIDEPARYAAHLFMETLEREGIVVAGTAMNARLLYSGDDESTETMEIIRHESPSIQELLPVVLGNSQNLYAEVLLREIALETGYPTTFRGGSDAVTHWLSIERLHRTGFVMVDGSGLSPINRTPTRMVTDLLVRQYKGKNMLMWRDALATPGKRSLANRMQGADFAPLQGNLHAKTGYGQGTHSLAGYLTSPGKVDHAFAIIVSDFAPDMNVETRDFIDQLTVMLQQAPELR